MPFNTGRSLFQFPADGLESQPSNTTGYALFSSRLIFYCLATHHATTVLRHLQCIRTYIHTWWLRKNGSWHVEPCNQKWLRGLF